MPELRMNFVATRPAGAASAGINIIVRRNPPKPSALYDVYWRFAAERQAVFNRRRRGGSGPWTTDPILRVYKFTNAYRISDRVSQFLLSDVIISGSQSPREVFFRTLLFKFFNRIDTWEFLRKSLGVISLKAADFPYLERALSVAFEKGQKIYSAAYIMPSGGRNSNFGRKHQMHLALLKKMLDQSLPERIEECKSMRSAFAQLRAFPTIGDFLAYQYVTDLNYGPLIDFSEMEFVCPGPGAREGLRKCFVDFGDYDEPGLIEYVALRQDEEFARLGLVFERLGNRPLQLIDCQNLFCEVAKYTRVSHPEVLVGGNGRKRIKQRFKPNHSPIKFLFPPKWGPMTTTTEGGLRCSL